MTLRNLLQQEDIYWLLGNIMQGTGQCQKAGQLQLTYPRLGYNANSGNQGYESNTSSSGAGAVVGHYAMHTVGVNQPAQSQSIFLPVNSQLSLNHFYPNSGQKASNQNNMPIVNLNQQRILAQKSSMSENLQLAMVNGNLVYCQTQTHSPTTPNQCPKSRMDSVSATMTNPTVSSTMAQMCYSQQSAVQRPAYNQTAQQTSYAPYTSYAIKPNDSFSSVPNTQNAQVYTITPVTLLPASCVSKVHANNSVQNNYSVPQTNDSRIRQSLDGTTPPSNRMVPNAVNNQNNLLSAVPVQTNSYKQTSARSNFNVQTGPPTSNDCNSLYTSSVSLPSQTCLQNNVSARSNLKDLNAASLQPPLQTKPDNSIFYDRMNDISNSSGLHAPDSIRYGSLVKIDTVSSAHAKDCSLQVSPGRGLRAVAVVLPLSQENAPIKHNSHSSLSSSNPSSDSGLFSSCQMDKASVQPPDTMCLKQNLQQSTGSSNISTDKESPVASSSPMSQGQLNEHNATIKLSSLPLTFAQLVKQHDVRTVKQGNKETPDQNAGQKLGETEKPCEENLSSVPTTEWTLGKLYEKIIDLEYKENGPKSDKKNVQYNCASQVVYRFWNGDCKALLNDARHGTVSKEISGIRKFCAKIDINTVVFSQNQTKDPSRYHVLLHDEVYKEEKSFTSFWRNINQLDDIDREFGFPYFLQYGQQVSQNEDTEPEPKQKDKRENEANPAVSNPEELQNKKVPSNQTPFVNTNDTEKHNTQPHLNPDTEKRTDENECISNAQATDSNYSFKIEVLSPEKAKVIFEKVERDSLGTDTTVSEENPPHDQEDAENQTCQVPILKKICCIEKWKERIFGSSSESKCKCNEQSQDDQNLGQSEDMIGWPMETVDLTEDSIIFPQESENSQLDKSPKKSTLILSSESEDESQVCTNQTDLQNNKEENLALSIAWLDDAETNKNIFENSNRHESGLTLSDTLLEQVQDCRAEPGKSSAETTDIAKSVCPLPICGVDVNENKIISCENPDILLRPFKKPKLSVHFKSQTILESFSKSKTIGPVETVELALFGSKHKKLDSGSSQEGHVQSSRAPTISMFKKNVEAPRRVYVKISPQTKSDKQGVEPLGNISVKKRIHDNWRKSLPLATIKLKRKNRRFSIVSAIHGTTVHQSPITHRNEKKRKREESKDGHGGKLKWTLSNEKVANALRVTPVDEAGSPQENVLKFKVLPSTFNFEEGCNDTDSPSTSTTSTTGDETVPVLSSAEGTTPIKTKEGWCDKSTGESSLQSPAAAPESTSLFQEFQKRFKMRQVPMDE